MTPLAPAVRRASHLPARASQVRSGRGALRSRSRVKGGKVEKNISLPRRASLSRRALALAVAGTGAFYYAASGANIGRGNDCYTRP